ncbi:class I SAM-dependent methyltransferase [Candidatus Methylacidiphilum infernorum]|uniref:Predicted O-methyltransferase n=1 Tax=Methylacidiphilum infernorum (isolate V4) TaxID=481448 RepID=B3DZ24_METI4|nr:class I SAM-dependent methyltransferase [Candidatus Methylacidiphilum infernorum]ACD84116.1 Predicted O-methyltransferase [Methylacidiphilum infernorum V4]
MKQGVKKSNDQEQAVSRAIEIEDWYPYGASLEPRWEWNKRVHPLLDDLLGSRLQTFEGYLRAWKKFVPALLSINSFLPLENLSAFWHNRWFTSLDGVALFGMIAQEKPGLYLEMGSGYSTLFAYAAKKAHSPTTKIVTIDPAPRIEVSPYIDEAIQSTLQDSPPSLFERLQAGDILFIDGSHRVLQGSDVTVFFLEVLPVVKPGVLVHLHDIFWPVDYPKAWSKRYYSEQYLLAALFLYAQEKFDILFASHYISMQPGLVQVLNELWTAPQLQGLKPLGGSFWFRKKA